MIGILACCKVLSWSLIDHINSKLPSKASPVNSSTIYLLNLMAYTFATSSGLIGGGLILGNTNLPVSGSSI
jgi:hypothetical protein